MEFMKRASNFV